MKTISHQKNVIHLLLKKGISHLFEERGLSGLRATAVTLTRKIANSFFKNLFFPYNYKIISSI